MQVSNLVSLFDKLSILTPFQEGRVTTKQGCSNNAITVFCSSSLSLGKLYASMYVYFRVV